MPENNLTIDDALKFFGVSRDISEDDLHANYIALSKKLHPDRNPNSETALDAFHEVQNHYDFLKIALFSDRRAARRQNIYLLEIPLSGFVSGMNLDEFDARCCQCDGHGLLEVRTCRSCHGKGGKPCVVGMLETTDICVRCGGTGKENIICGVCNKGTRYFNQKLSFPPRTRPGTMINIGESIIELILKQENSRYLLDGDDIVTKINVPYTTMVYGGNRNISIPGGQKISIKIPEYCKPGRDIRIPNMGLGEPGEYGSFRVSVFPSVPDPKKMKGLVAWCMKRLQKAGI